MLRMPSNGGGKPEVSSLKIVSSSLYLQAIEVVNVVDRVDLRAAALIEIMELFRGEQLVLLWKVKVSTNRVIELLKV